MLASLTFDFLTRRAPAPAQLVDRESKKPKVIVMRPVAMRRTGPSITDAAEVVACLLETIVAPRNTFGKPGAVPRDVIDGPMVPGACRRIGIVAK
jgi:hypothetical protein